MGIAIGVGLALIVGVIYLFFKNIIVFDSGLIALVTGILLHNNLSVHSAFCLLIGLGIFILLVALQNTTVGFWVIGTVCTLFWSIIFGCFGPDRIWQVVIFGLSFIILFGLRIYAREQNSF